MEQIMQKMNVKKVISVLLLLAVLLLSVNVISKKAGDPETHAKTIQALDDKKADVLKLTAASTAASAALAAVPGDSTTPVANKLVDLTSYFLVILIVIFLEKILVSLTGYAAFSILIPAACILLIIGICLNRSALKILAGKVAAFGLILFLIIPVSMKVSAMVEEIYNVSVESAVEEAKDITEEIDENSDSEGNFLDRALSKIKDGVTGVLEKGENLLNYYIETVAVMIVTSCVIPILVLVFMIWLAHLLFGISVHVPKEMPGWISSKLPRRRSGEES